jgi:tRNA(Ile2) C34 agmatinyltransferase TiaS
MSDAVNQFLELVRHTWSAWLYCPKCAAKTEHIGRAAGDWECYRCTACGSEQKVRVR